MSEYSSMRYKAQKIESKKHRANCEAIDAECREKFDSEYARHAAALEEIDERVAETITEARKDRRNDTVLERVRRMIAAFGEVQHA
jgi:hypothetical protein